MKKSVIWTVTLIVVVLLVTLVAPVFAKEKVSATFSTNKVKTTGGTTVTTPSGVVHVWGAIRTANATVTYGSNLITNGSVTVDVDYIVDPMKETTTQHYHKMTIIFPVQKGLSSVGTFEGVLTWTASYTPPYTPTSIISSTQDTHAVLHGSGSLDGYMLFLDKDPDKSINYWMLLP
jgi:hypothetical protein